jgi:hypothetical protein
MSDPSGPAGAGQRPDSSSGHTAFATLLVLVGLVGVAIAGLVVIGTNLVSARSGPPAAEQHSADTAVGASSDGYEVWANNDDGTPVRWDPCTPIELAVNDEGAPEGWRADLDRAITTIAEASGLDIRMSDSTDERPEVRRAAYQPNRYGERWAPVLVAWAIPEEGALPLRTSDRGLAIPVAVGVAGDRTYVTGQVVLNTERTDLRVGWEDRATSWGATILHELGHLLGLAHVDDPAQVMSRFPGEGAIELGDGDRTGLAAVGRDAGCRQVPDPTPIDIPDPRSELDLHREGH